MKLSDISYYVTERINSSNISLEEYVTTDSLLPNKAGRTMAVSLPPTPCNLVHYKENDILVANIRPYLKKIWKADCSGGASADVLVFRAKDNFPPDFLHAVLLNDAFYTHVMKAPTGAKMPRGEKNHILRYSFKELDIDTQQEIGKHISALDRKIALNRKENEILEKMAKRLYDYWFVQFDFPDENGRPYKSSGGAMEYNPILKREIPKGWEVKRLDEISKVCNGATPSTTIDDNYGGDIIWITPKDLSDQKSKFIFRGERNITQYGFESCSTSLLPKGSILLSSRAPIGLLSIASNEMCTNQGFKSIVPINMSDNLYLYFYLKMNMKQIEQMGSGTTFKEVSRESMNSFSLLYVSDRFLYSKWAELIGSIFTKQETLQLQSLRLASLRDFLLPLLLNGQVTIKD